MREDANMIENEQMRYRRGKDEGKRGEDANTLEIEGRREDWGRRDGGRRKHQARMHSAPIRPARHGKSMGKAWESVGNMRRDSIKNSALTRPAKRPESR